MFRKSAQSLLSSKQFRKTTTKHCAETPNKLLFNTLHILSDKIVYIYVNKKS